MGVIPKLRVALLNTGFIPSGLWSATVYPSSYFLFMQHTEHNSGYGETERTPGGLEGECTPITGGHITCESKNNSSSPADRNHVAGVPLQGLDALPRPHIPDLRGVVTAPGGKQVWGTGRRGNPSSSRGIWSLSIRG